ncbi:carboxypeptidase regulatory-like domain-containing protein [Bacteroidota bacterium]
MRRQILIACFTILIFQPGLAQPTQTIRGRVFDQESYMPLLGANVFILEAGPITGVISGENGNFEIKDVPVGRYNIMVSHMGFKSFVARDVVVGSGKEVFLDVGMREFIVEMEGIDVAANVSKDQTINPMAGISARSFTVEETEKFPGSWGDPARMAANYAGVFPNGDIYNYIVVRGNSPYGLIWRMEGIPIPNPNHFDFPGARGGPISIVNNKLLAQSDFLTSAFPAEYSNGVSGVFDLNLRNGNSQKREYVTEIGLMGLSFGAEGPFSKNSGASYMFDCRISLLGLVDELLWVEALPRYQDLNFKLNFPTKKGNISVFGYGGNSRILGIMNDSVATTPAYKRQLTSESGARTGVTGIKYVRFLGSRTRLISDFAASTNRSFQYNDSLVNKQLSRVLIKNQYQEDRLLLSFKLLSKLSARNSINAGISMEDHFIDYYLQNEYDIFAGVSGDSLVTYPPHHLTRDHLFVFKSYFEWKHRFSNTLTLYTGLNYLHFLMNNSKALEPRTNLRWRFKENQILSIGYGLHSQLHPFFHYFVRQNTTGDPYDRENYIETNLDLDFTRSHHFALGYDLAISADMRFKAEVYQQLLFDIPVESNPSFFSMINSGAGSFNRSYHDLVNEGTARNQGLDLTLEKFLSNRYYFLLTASLLDSKYEGSDGVLRNTAFNSNYNLNGLVGYEIPVRTNGSIDLNIRMVTAGGRRYIPHDEAQTIIERDDVYIYDEAFEHRLANYFRIDTRFAYKYNGLKLRHEVALDITNLTNRPNEWERLYDDVSKSIEMIYQQGLFFFIYYRINF